VSLHQGTSRSAGPADGRHVPARAPIIGSILALAVLGLLAFALVRVQSDSREEVEQRFAERARVTAALTESLFGSSVASSAELNTRRYGAPRVASATLERVATEGRSPYAIVLGSKLEVIAASSGATPAITAALAQRPPHIEQALSKAGFGLSSILASPAGATVEFASAFRAADGTPRVYVSALSSQVLSGFLGGYLKRIPKFENSFAYLVDANNKTIASTVADAKPGEPLDEPGLVRALAGGHSGDFGERYFTADAVAGTPWRVILTVSQSDLYSSVSGNQQLIPWLAFILLAIAAAVSVWLLLRVVHAAATVADVNDQLAISHRRLELRAGELARSNAELEQFASVASHDLQEPLRKVQAFGEQLETKYAANLPEEGIDYLRRMRSASSRMQVLIDDLLTFARVTTRAQPYEHVDLGMIAREVAEDLDSRIDELRATLEIGPLPSLDADPLQMRQLMQNLLSNALKFHRPDVPPRVRLEGDERAGDVVITVRDNGIGFEDRHRERIFRVFERLHGRTSYDGTGIGLALCRRIVERHRGTISAHGVPGEGSTFTVVLPLHAMNQDDDDEAPGVPADPELAHVS